MTTYVVELVDAQELPVEATGVIVESGALRFFAGTGATVLVVAPRIWRSVRGPGGSRLPTTRPKPTPTVVPPGRF